LTPFQGFEEKVDPYKRHSERVERIREGGKEDPVVKVPGEADGPGEGADAEEEGQGPLDICKPHPDHQIMKPCRRCVNRITAGLLP